MKAFLFALAACVFAGRLHAQCATTSIGSASMSPASVTVSTPTITQFDAGFATFSVTLTITPSNSGKKYDVCLLATTPTLGTATGVAYTKPLSDLQFSLDQTTWTTISTSQQLIASRTSAAQSIVLYFRVALAYALDAAGNYGTSVTARISS